MRDPFKLPPFAKLRGRMAEYGETCETLGDALGFSRMQLCNRLNLHIPFELDLMYRIMEHYEIPADQLHEYFPRDGGVKPRKNAAA